MPPPRSPLLLPLLACVAAAAASAGQAAEEVSLPLGELRHKPAPRGYVALKCSEDVHVDGRLSDPCWQVRACCAALCPAIQGAHQLRFTSMPLLLRTHVTQAAAWTADFVDIVGPTGPAPWFRTRAKMLWSSTQGLLIGAELEEPRAFAHERLHDRCMRAHACSSAASAHGGMQ